MRWNDMVDVGPTWFEIQVILFAYRLLVVIRCALGRRFKVVRLPKDQLALPEGV